MRHFIDYARQQAKEAREMAVLWPKSARRLEEVAIGWDAIVIRLENEERENRESRWEA